MNCYSKSPRLYCVIFRLISETNSTSKKPVNCLIPVPDTSVKSMANPSSGNVSENAAGSFVVRGVGLNPRQSMLCF
jgi:hypothetical protein